MALLTLDDCSQLEISNTDAKQAEEDGHIYYCPECSVEVHEPVFHNIPDSDPDRIAALFT